MAFIVFVFLTASTVQQKAQLLGKQKTKRETHRSYSTAGGRSHRGAPAVPRGPSSHPEQGLPILPPRHPLMTPKGWPDGEVGDSQAAASVIRPGPYQARTLVTPIL